ncbi:MAG TPA: hypothetical protein VJ476_13085 [Rhizomicrobium sp.]|nr:hypothetical protein [Rhizomicrobium sp.]
MTQADAAGRKTESRPSSIEGRLDEQLALLTDGMRDALTRAGQITLEYDEYGNRRGSEFGHAIAIAKTSADIVLALAKLSGQFNHDINVRHVAADTPPPPKK